MHDYAVQCYTLSGGKDIPVQTGHDMPQSTLYGVFTAQDGYLVIAAQVDEAWKRFAKLAGGEAFAADTRFHSSNGRNENRLEILAVAKTWVDSQTVAQCLAALDAIDVPSAKVQTIAEVLDDPQIQARNMVIEQDHPVLGKIRLPNLPFRFSGCDTSPTCVAPDTGQHNRDIASSPGYNADNIETLVRDVTHNLHCPFKGKRILLLGAGGAARGALLPMLEQAPAELVIVNRTLQKAYDLASLKAQHGRVRSSSYVDLVGQTFDVVFNATSASLRGELPPVPASVFVGCELAYELAYGKGGNSLSASGTQRRGQAAGRWRRYAGRAGGGSLCLVARRAARDPCSD